MGSEVAGGFVCSVCGERHALPLSYSTKAPVDSAKVPAGEQEGRVQMSAEQCVIDQRAFYLRGRIVVPVHGLAEPFIWGVWAEVGPKDFLRANELWKVEGREAEPAFDGYLNSVIPIYGAVNDPEGSTINLELEVRTRPVGERPQFFLKALEHPLAVEQREGISMDRVREIAERVLHPLPPPVSV